MGGRVFLNGELLAAHDNMFVPLEVGVTKALASGSNRLRVEIDSAPRIGRDRRARHLAKEGLPDDVAHFDERASATRHEHAARLGRRGL